MVTRRWYVAVVCALAATAMMGASPHAGATWHRTNFVTVNIPVGLPGVTLAPGTYIFELADPLMSADIVRVFNKDRSMVYFTAFTERVERPADWPADRPLSLGEARPGLAPPILAWYPAGETRGYGFRYGTRRR